MNSRRTAVLIHGAWVTPLCWRYFAHHFVERGFQVVLPAWPLKDGPIADQLANPDPRLASIGIPEIVEHHKTLIRNLGEPPVLVGHSFGGLIVQILLDQGCGAAGIAISSVPPQGVPAIHFLSHGPLEKMRSLFGMPFRWRRILPPPKPSPNEVALRREQGIETHFVPESGRIFWQLFTRAARVDFGNAARPPLLLAACGKDRTFPAETYRRNYSRYDASKSRTDFIVFPELTHFSIAEPGHEALADYCAKWAEAALGGTRYGSTSPAARA